MKTNTSKTPEITTSAVRGFDFKPIKGQRARLIDLSTDPNYQRLIDAYQHAEFAKCKELLAPLEERYPQHPGLLKFNEDLQMKLSLRSVADIIKKEKKREKRKATFNLSLFAVIATFLTMMVLMFSNVYFKNVVVANQLEQETSQLSLLVHQAEQLLLVGNPQPAAELVEKISLVNPHYENLPALASRTHDLLQLEAQYQKALNLLSENHHHEAWIILTEIETERPGLWDVSQHIVLIENTVQIVEYSDEGNAAYHDEQWYQVIRADENVLNLIWIIR
jgi:D-ribose pyranose/furanose isomerase RbsD